MTIRTLSALCISLVLVSTAHSATLYRLPDPKLDTAAQRMKLKEHRPAYDIALQSSEGGVRNFLAGMAAYRLEKYEEAAQLLAAAPAGFPLLADYALFYYAAALAKTGHHKEAGDILTKLLKDYPETPLVRQAEFLAAECLFEQGQYQPAQDAYRSFIEKYSAGSDALSARYQYAICIVKSGDKQRAATELRSLWLAYPASKLSDNTEQALKSLEQEGIVIPPYSAEELYRRANTLYDLKRYSEAVQQLDNLRGTEIPPELSSRALLRKAQALFRLRQYEDAEKAFLTVDEKLLKKELAEELSYWRGRTLEKTGKNADAYISYIKLATDSPSATLADDALFEAAYVMKVSGKSVEAGQLFSRLIQQYPESPLSQRALWEAAWERYSAADFTAAAEHFRKLKTVEATRERGTYWLAKTLEAAGDKPGAQEQWAQLLKDFPYGFYAFEYRKLSGLKDTVPVIDALELTALLPIPQGYERIKALITLGFLDEAKNELSILRKKNHIKPKALKGIARLYLEMQDYYSALKLFQKEGNGKTDPDTPWGINFPLAYRDDVSKNAAKLRLSEALIYSLIRAESSFSPCIASPVGAIGLMQLMPSTAKSMKPKSSQKNVTAKLTIPSYNIALGTRHLRDLLNQYKGDEVLAIAAYNAGSGNVDRWLKAFGSLKRDEFIENIPFSETREYVKKVLTGSEIYRRLYQKTPLDPKPFVGNPPATGVPECIVPTTVDPDEDDSTEESKPTTSRALPSATS